MPAARVAKGGALPALVVEFVPGARANLEDVQILRIGTFNLFLP